MLSTVFVASPLWPFFAYPLGLLLSRFRPGCSRHPIATVTGMALLLLLLLCVPSLHGWNVAYEAFCVVLAFPLIVWLGACCQVKGFVGRTANLLGRLSLFFYEEPLRKWLTKKAETPVLAVNPNLPEKLLVCSSVRQRFL